MRPEDQRVNSPTGAKTVQKGRENDRAIVFIPSSGHSQQNFSRWRRRSWSREGRGSEEWCPRIPGKLHSATGYRWDQATEVGFAEMKEKHVLRRCGRSKGPTARAT